MALEEQSISGPVLGLRDCSRTAWCLQALPFRISSEPWSELLVSPLITPVVPYTIPHITPPLRSLDMDPQPHAESLGKLPTGLARDMAIVPKPRPQYRPQNTIVFILGAPGKGTRNNFGTPAEIFSDTNIAVSTFSFFSTNRFGSKAQSLDP